MTSVFIVARQPALRAGLAAMLAGEGLRVLGDSAALGELPLVDVVVVAGDDVPLELSGADCGVVLLADEPPSGLAGLGLRGWSILPPEVSAERLAAAVGAVAYGLVVLDPVAAQSLGSRAPVPAAAPEALQEPLTTREMEVLQLVSEGLSNKLIARRLAISEHTVKFHVSSTYAKLGAANRTEAVSQAARRGLISL